MYHGLPILTNKQKGLNPDPIHGDAKAGIPPNSDQTTFSLTRDGVEKHMYERYKLCDEMPSNQQYTWDARQAIKDVLKRGKLPILEGGSIYFFKNIFRGNSMEESKEDVDAMKNARLEASLMVTDF